MRGIPVCLILFLLSLPAFADEHTAYIPQIADGQGWRTQINIAALNNMEGRIDLYATDGEPLIADLEVSDLGQLRTNTIVFDLRQGESLIVKTAGLSDPVAVGFAVISYASANEAAINGLFQYYQDGKMKSEAGIDAASMVSTSVVPIDILLSLNVGVAIVTRNYAHAFTEKYTIELIDTKNQVIAAETVEITHHGAKYLTELFPDLDLTSFQGSLVITDGPYLAATALRVADDLSTLSSLPVEPRPPTSAPEIAAVQTGAGITVGVQPKTYEGVTSAEVQMKMAGTDLWVTVHFGHFQGVFSFWHYGPGIYYFKARLWNGGAAGPFSKEIFVIVPSSN